MLKMMKKGLLTTVERSTGTDLFFFVTTVTQRAVSSQTTLLEAATCYYYIILSRHLVCDLRVILVSDTPGLSRNDTVESIISYIDILSTNGVNNVDAEGKKEKVFLDMCVYSRVFLAFTQPLEAVIHMEGALCTCSCFVLPPNK